MRDDNLMWQQPSDLGPIPIRGQETKNRAGHCAAADREYRAQSHLLLLLHNGWPGQALVLCQDNFIRFTAGRGIYSKHRPSHHTSQVSQRNQLNVRVRNCHLKNCV